VELVTPADLTAGAGTRRVRELTEPHRRELQVHCYRCSDPSPRRGRLQDTLLAAWQGSRVRGRASLPPALPDPTNGASTRAGRPAGA